MRALHALIPLVAVALAACVPEVRPADAVDASGDVASDAATDAGGEVGRDVEGDARRDAATDAAGDATADAAGDADAGEPPTPCDYGETVDRPDGLRPMGEFAPAGHRASYASDLDCDGTADLVFLPTEDPACDGPYVLFGRRGERFGAGFLCVPLGDAFDLLAATAQVMTGPSRDILLVARRRSDLRVFLVLIETAPGDGEVRPTKMAPMVADTRDVTDLLGPDAQPEDGAPVYVDTGEVDGGDYTDVVFGTAHAVVAMPVSLEQPGFGGRAPIRLGPPDFDVVQRAFLVDAPDDADPDRLIIAQEDRVAVLRREGAGYSVEVEAAIDPEAIGHQRAFALAGVTQDAVWDLIGVGGTAERAVLTGVLLRPIDDEWEGPLGPVEVASMAPSGGFALFDDTLDGVVAMDVDRDDDHRVEVVILDDRSGIPDQPSTLWALPNVAAVEGRMASAGDVAPRETALPEGFEPTDLVAGDFDGDGTPEVVVVDPDGEIRCYSVDVTPFGADLSPCP